MKIFQKIETRVAVVVRGVLATALRGSDIMGKDFIGFRCAQPYAILVRHAKACLSVRLFVVEGEDAAAENRFVFSLNCFGGCADII